MQPETSSVAPSYRRPCAETSHRPCGFRRAEHHARARQGQNPQGRWREYRTENEILPLIARQLQSEFLPQSVPFYAATQNFLQLHRDHPQYSYKEATLNPMNLRDRAMDWEADIIQRFRNDASVREFVGERDTPMGGSLFLAKPIRTGAACMACHE